MSLRPAKLNVRPISEDDEDPSIILVEGDQKALEWLGNLLIEHAKGNSGCGRQIYPKGPGSAYFAKTSLMGIYIHRLPCDHPTAASEKAAGRKFHKRNPGKGMSKA